MICICRNKAYFVFSSYHIFVIFNLKCWPTVWLQTTRILLILDLVSTQRLGNAVSDLFRPGFFFGSCHQEGEGVLPSITSNHLYYGRQTYTE